MTSKPYDPIIIEHIDEGIITLEGGVVRQVNRALVKMTDTTHSKLIGQMLTDLFDNLPAEFPSQSRPSETSGLLAPQEAFLKTAAGPSRDVAVSMISADDKRENLQFVVVRDIAERKKMQKELLKARQLESIAALSGGIAHDYNNLLTAIMGNISLALTGIPEDDAIYDWLSQAQDAALIAKELTNRLITFSKGGSPPEGNRRHRRVD